MATDREKLCKALGFDSPVALHGFLVQSIRGDIGAIRRRRLDPAALGQLGYTRDGLRKLGCSESQLAAIGFERTGPPPEPERGPPAAEPPSSDAAAILALIARQTPHGRLREMGITAVDCRTAGADVGQLLRLGFPFSELCRVYTIQELKRAGNGVRDLATYFRDEELKAAGFSAYEMRLAGRSIQQLQRLGYNDNHIRTAGFSMGELIAAGLAKQTRDVIRGQ